MYDTLFAIQSIFPHFIAKLTKAKFLLLEVFQRIFLLYFYTALVLAINKGDICNLRYAFHSIILKQIYYVFCSHNH